MTVYLDFSKAFDKAKKMRWFGHVERAGGGALNEVRELRVEGRRPPGRPKKKWSGCVREHMNLLEIEEHMAQDQSCGEQSSPVQPHLKRWENREAFQTKRKRGVMGREIQQEK